MSRPALLMIVLMIAAGPAAAQVQVSQLAAPDAFSTAGRETGLPSDLWRGTPIETARAVLPLVATRPLSPAAAALARGILATGAEGPEGSAGDAGLVGARANGLIALGDVAAAAKILDRAPGLDRNADLARAAAETALLKGDPVRACAVATALSTGRGEIYWLRLRAFCQFEAGQTAQAQLTFDLAQTQARDATYGRLMTARLSGTAPGVGSLRNGLDLALSKALGLNLATIKPAPAVAAAASEQAPPAPIFDVTLIDASVGGLATALRDGVPPEAAVSALIATAAEADLKTRVRLQSAALLIAALAGDLPARDRAKIAGFTVAEGRAPSGRNLALDAAGGARRAGEVALLALATSVEVGSSGPALGDRVRIIHALAKAGLVEDARRFALEGLAGLK